MVSSITIILKTPNSLPRQITLDLGYIPEVTLSNFISTGNENLIATLHAIQKSWLSTPETPDLIRMDLRMIHAWGPSGSGRTHILQAMSNKALELGIDTFALDNRSTPDEWRSAGKAIENQTDFPFLLCVDDVDYLDEFAQGALFRIHNLIRESKKQCLISTSSLPPASLRLRDDLRTRLAWGLVFQMHALSDAEKLQALQQAANARGLQLSNDVIPWLLRHFHRDMPSLMSMLEALDVYSLETKRAITLPLVKEMLAQKN
jgi:DnaA family protein